MTKIPLSILMIIQATICFGQLDTIFIRYDKNQFDEELKYEIDTFIYEPPKSSVPLIGTTVLPWTTNQQIAKGYGLYLESVKIGECENSGTFPELNEEEIVSINESDSTLIIKTKILGNCCHDFLCDVQILEESKINLIQYSYGNTHCTCICCFGLTYEFSIMKVDEFDKLEMVLLNGNKKTLKKK